jgi:cyclic pyranopterin phosphate synthase
MRAVRASVEAGIHTKINAVLISGCNEEAFLPLVQMASELPVDVRFIELMPIGEGRSNRGMDNRTLIEKLYATFPGTVPDPAPRGNGPAVYYAVPGFTGRIGFISAIHGKFCDSCNRVRLTSTGFLKQCLCYEDGADLRAILRSGKETGRRTLLAEAIRSAASGKPEAHSFDRPELITEKHRMSGIGG